jgi:hypothetical protein
MSDLRRAVKEFLKDADQSDYAIVLQKIERDTPIVCSIDGNTTVAAEANVREK